jgi:YgiT-type zinc finger domain-containing protein
MGAKQTKVEDDERGRIILNGLRAWRREHPNATLYEMERETMRRMAELQAHILEELSKDLPSEGESQEAARHCPECGAKMQRRGEAERQLQGVGGQNLHLKRDYWVCPACGAGIFPPG